MIPFAFRNLLSRPLRSVLSVLGLAVAIAGMVGLFSIAGGIDRVVASTFEKIPGLLVQQQGAPVPLFSSLPASWQQELEALPGVGVVESQVFCRVNQLEKKLILNPPRFAVGIDIEARMQLKRSVYAESLVAGRFLDQQDQLQNRCVVSREIAESIGKQVGDSLTINGAPFELIGIYHTGSLMLDVNLLMDIQTCRRLGRIDESTVGCFYVEPDGTLDKRTLKASILDHFRGRDPGQRADFGFGTGSRRGNPLAQMFRSIDRSVRKSETTTDETTVNQAQDGNASQPPNLLNDSTAAQTHTPTEELSSPVEVRSAEDWSERIEEFSGDLNIFLALMTTIGVSIATLSIVNTMMMSVTERTTEFGILRANGWTKGEVVRLMTMESGLLGLLGGLLGVLAGWIGTQVVNTVWPDRLQLHAGMSLMLFSLVFSVGLGLFGGVYPAWRASRLSPMESIRRG